MFVDGLVFMLTASIMKASLSDQKIEALLGEQTRYFSEGNTKPLAARMVALERLESAIVEGRDDLLLALAQDLGKPAVEAYLAEYYFLLQELRLVKKSMKKWLKPKRVSSPFYFQPCRTEIHRDPYGAVLILSPWNYPVQLALSPLIAAVAAGNTVFLKPSEVAGACEKWIVDIIEKSFSPEHVAVVTGDGSVANYLLGLSFDFIFFTGSTAIGRIVAERAARNLTPVILELGGKCPCIVDASADLEVTARRILAGKFFNGGQTCFAPDFVVVDASVKDKLLEAMKRVMESTPWEKEMAHVISEAHYDRLLNLVEGKEIKQGEDDRDQLRLAPRILPEASWDDRVMQEEVFGPILPIINYSNVPDLIKSLSGYGSPLALYVFSENHIFQQDILGAIRSGGVAINDTMKQGSQLHAPFGGVGESGYGRYRGRFGVEALSYERIVFKRSSRFPELFELMPPYEGKLKWLKRFLK